jgi:hypothetical protein
MRVESVDTLSLLELRAMVAQRLQAHGVLDRCTAEDRRAILAQACLVIWHLTAGAVLDTLARLGPDIIAAVQGYVAACRARFRQDGWHPTQWSGCCDGLNGTILEVFVTDTRQQALAACERDVS